MKQHLNLLLLLFICIFLLFASAMKFTEDENFKNLNIQYSSSENVKNNYLSLIPKPTVKQIQLQKSKVNTYILKLAYSFIIPIFFLVSGISLNIKNYVQGKTKSIILLFAIYFILYSLIDYLCNLPIDYFSQFYRNHIFGLSNQSFNKWFTDTLLNFSINTITGVAVIWIPYLLFKKALRLWWLYLGILTIPFLIFLSYISPMYIEPLFNHEELLKNGQLLSDINDQLKKSGIENCKIYVVNKSEDTKEMNAYMTGVFNTKRIVLWDNTIKNMTEKEILTVTGHEIGHYKLNHVWKGIFFCGLLYTFIFYAINKSAIGIIRNSNGTLGFNSLSDIASLPLIILLFNVFIFMSSPISNSYSRYHEREADRFSLELTKDNSSFIESQIKLHQGNLSFPNSGIIYMLWNYDHPTYMERIHFGETYKPWEENKPLKYEKFITK
jgi:STE24 endopeptidase